MKWNKDPRNEDELSSSDGSFVNDNRSKGFWSSSDLSDCECCEERLRFFENPCYLFPLVPVSSCPIMSHSQKETTPLLGTASPRYKSLQDSDSLGPADLSSQEILNSHRKRLEQKQKPERRKQSSLVTIFSVWNTIMGSSLLTMAWGVERAGLPMALLLVLVMAGLCLYTAYLLLEVNRHHGTVTCEVPALCRTLLGRGAEVVAHGFSLVVLLGANVVYWVLISNFLYFSVNYFVDLNKNATYEYTLSPLCPNDANSTIILADSTIDAASKTDPWYWALRSTVPVYVAAIVFPLLNFRNVTFFTKFNSLGVEQVSLNLSLTSARQRVPFAYSAEYTHGTLSVIYLIVFVVVKGYMWGINVMPSAVHAGKHAAVLSGMLALSFYIHNIIITIMSNNRKQDNNGRDLTISFVLVTLTYTLVGTVFYICFPLAKSCIEDNMLNNFEMHDVMTAVARLLLLFQVITVYPLVAFMLRTEATLLLPMKDSNCLMVTINACIVAVCMLVACFCPNIGLIIRYTGAVSGLVHIFALPSLLQMRSLHIRNKLTWLKTIFYTLIMVLGAVNFIMQFSIQE